MSASLNKYRRAFEYSQLLLDIIAIDEFPVDLFKILSLKKGAPIFVLSTKDFNEQNHKRLKEKALLLKVQDAKCFYDPKQNAYIVFYNQSKPSQRIRFSLAHELAHIVLGHLEDDRTALDRGGVEEKIYRIMEGEANTFAGNFLAPPILIRAKLSGLDFNENSISKIAKFFDLSISAVKNYRIKDYKEWLENVPSLHEKSILNRCSLKLFPKYCPRCKYAFYGKETKFCPICGNGQIKDGGKNTYKGDDMKYNQIETDVEGKILSCLTCQNENFVDKAEYCHICGSPLINYCSLAHGYGYDDASCSHQEPLPGNARYCPYCGSETTFNRKNILVHWNTERESILDDEEIQNMIENE